MQCETRAGRERREKPSGNSASSHERVNPGYRPLNTHRKPIDTLQARPQPHRIPQDARSPRQPARIPPHSASPGRTQSPATTGQSEQSTSTNPRPSRSPSRFPNHPPNPANPRFPCRIDHPGSNAYTPPCPLSPLISLVFPLFSRSSPPSCLPAWLPEPVDRQPPASARLDPRFDPLSAHLGALERSPAPPFAALRRAGRACETGHRARI